MAQIFTATYLYFTLMPWYTRVEQCKEVPERVRTPTADPAGPGAAAAGGEA